jgi:hypothetical protein
LIILALKRVEEAHRKRRGNDGCFLKHLENY